MPKNILEVENLKKVYGSKKDLAFALKGIDFSVFEGEIFGLLGPNGAGKSTTLNILIGLLTPTSGTVKIFGKDFFENEEHCNKPFVELPKQEFVKITVSKK